MCGIVGYVGRKNATDILLEGLKRLEYRGYDSAGLAVMGTEAKLKVVKAVGKTVFLEEKLTREPATGQAGIAHTRWATHGVPSEANAHPHLDCAGRLALVHNGIVENHEELKRRLEALGHRFVSATDTEVLAHLIEEHARHRPFEEALCAALKEVVGTFGLAVVMVDQPRTVYGARRGSPLVVGVGRDGENYLASDPAALIAHTRDIIYLGDDEVVRLDDNGIETFSLDRVRVTKAPETVSWSLQEIERGHHPHFMVKEIHEQPTVVRNALAGRLDARQGMSVLGGLKDVDERLRRAERLTISACGSAYLAGAIGAMMIEECAEIPVRAEIASELRYRKPIFDANREAFIAVSQSGETADTLGALREAKNKGVLTLGIVNVVGSAVARETDAGVFVHAGPEIAVASTKAFTAQLTVFALLAMHLGRQRRLSLAAGQRLAEELASLPEKVERLLEQDEAIRLLAKKYSRYPSFLYIGRKYNAPLANEGALKLKEVSYVHAEGYAAGEMKHGPIALLDDGFPVFAIATKDSLQEKVKSNVQEAKARRAPIVVLASEGDEAMAQLADDVIWVPRTTEMLSPILNVIPMQLFAYHLAVARGLDPDKPRNLAKAVTVE
ncbi:MAG: glutamine--fructose-6-phosphate transaminase (isomerizing) [Patescibacteria group bacterium]|nr:glutamine--fructose-6-phosphate transaminase (isomerizing) [Patescibacteria group bacterium]